MNNFAAINLEISIATQKLFSIGGIDVTNAMLTGFVGSLITIAILIYVGVMVRLGKYNRFVGLVQWVFEGLINQIDQIIPDRKLARKITPLACTIFFVILLNYWLSVLPGLDAIRFNGVAVLRSSTADLNFVLGLAIISTVAIQIYAIKYLGIFGNLRRYFRNPFKDPVGAFEGILEILGEVSRCGSLALRLFGNAFAGETLLIVIALLSSYASVLTLPIFIIFEMLIGFIQAYVFFVLTLIFTALAVGGHNESEENTKIEHSPAVDNQLTAQTE